MPCSGTEEDLRLQRKRPANRNYILGTSNVYHLDGNKSEHEHSFIRDLAPKEYLLIWRPTCKSPYKKLHRR